MGVGEQAAVAIGPVLRPPQDDLIPAGKRSKSCRCRGPGPVCAILRRSQRSNLDCRQADFAPIIEDESASIDNLADCAAGDLVAANPAADAAIKHAFCQPAMHPPWAQAKGRNAAFMRRRRRRFPIRLAGTP
jgi:hypothetical protein